ncbi:MAG: NAD(P)-binding protein [Candidatus Competibacteraceae bacterium]|nr:NAD(P)-binding protein [Candidatus Competibacteraceae bacterium]
MNIAIIGTGISGMTAAWLLHQEHAVTIFEANDTVGGHTNTVDVSVGGRSYAVDTGFIVFNDWTYPNFITLLDQLGVASQPTTMSFSVRCEKTGLEYNGNSLNTLFAQRRNLLRPAFYRMLRDILRFNRESLALLDSDDNHTTLANYLTRQCYGQAFIEQYLIPMGAAIWSAEPALMERIPARHFVQFFKNHGLLNITRRPQWRVIQGGSRCYAQRLIAPFQQRIRLSSPVEWVRRRPGGVSIKPRHGEIEHFDAVVIATHSDQALRLLADPSPQERDILGAIPYQENEAVLHTDTRLLPHRKLAWAAWNYRVLPQAQARATVTYNMNMLQGLDAPETFCVTLNDSQAVDPRKILYRTIYHHPVFTAHSLAAQQRWWEINGVARTWYCGAYWGNGFHEDGVNSAFRVHQYCKQRREAA